MITTPPGLRVYQAEAVSSQTRASPLSKNERPFPAHSRHLRTMQHRSRRAQSCRPLREPRRPGLDWRTAIAARQLRSDVDPFSNA
jgi:hypothetical protein